MLDNKTKQEIEALVKDLNKYNYYYHVLDKPIISDGEYDKLYYHLVDLEKQTGYVLPDSPTQRVGDEVKEGFSKVHHEKQLFSLDKAQNFEELQHWYDGVVQKFPDSTFTIEYKFDGLRLALTYEGGLLKIGATRGNGLVGEDVTAQVKTIRSVPLSIPFKGKIIIEGEGIMLISELDKYNLKSDDGLKNARNAVAGAIRNLDPKVTASRNLDFFAYGVPYIENKQFATQVELRQFLMDNHFLVGNFFEVRKDIKDIEDVVSHIGNIRNSIDILIDGAVVKLNEIPNREKLGYTIRFPKWALAYKFPPLEVTTTLRKVIWQVGRTGKLTPLAVLDPVDIAGATVKRATLNNWDDIQRKKVKINARVFLRRSNEVIPEILGVAQQDDSCVEITKPTVCPSCHTPLVQDGVNIYCPNIYKCPEQLKERIIHFCSRDAMNIEGIRDKTIDEMYDKLDIKTVADLYTLNEEKLLKLDKFKDKKANNIVQSLKKSKQANYPNFIFALGIDNVGIKTAKDLAKNFKTFDELRHANVESLSQIKDIGLIVAQSIVDYFKDEYNKEIIDKLFSCGVQIVYPTKSASSKFDNMTFVLTGTLPTLTRAEATKMIEDNGGRVSTSVSKQTTYVLLGEDAGSKLAKAMALGVKTISEEEFLAMLK